MLSRDGFASMRQRVLFLVLLMRLVFVGAGYYILLSTLHSVLGAAFATIVLDCEQYLFET